jgi:hypothetical protein
MKRYILVVTSFIVALSLSSCYKPIPKQDYMNTSVAMTLTAQQWTVTPSLTPIPSLTPTQTQTPTITLTPTIAPTKTPTMTPTRDPERFYAPSTEYSFIPPTGWEAVDITEKNPDIKEPIFIGPELGDYSLNLILYRDECPYGVLFFAAAIQDEFMNNDKSMKQIQEDFLVTDDGQEYFRWELTSVSEDVKYHQIFYFFGENEDVLTIVYTRLDSNGSELDSLVDKSMQTFIFHPIPGTVESGISG